MKCAACWLFPLLIAVATSSAHGSGLNLSWDTCYGEGAVHNRAFACSTNLGAESCVGSFVPFYTESDLTDITFVAEIASCSQDLPAWWQFRSSGACRASAMSVSWSADADGSQCQEMDSTPVALISSYETGLRDLFAHPLVRMTMKLAPASGESFSVVSGTEYFAFRISISHAKTVGTGSCAGCTTPATLQFSSAIFGNNHLAYPATWYVSPVSNYTPSFLISWQGGHCLVTPARGSTWGAVKALYR